MKILGIDYGKRKIGLATAEGNIAAPHSVLHVKSLDQAVKKVEEVVKAEKVEKIVVGISEGKMAEEQRAFAESLRFKLSLPTMLWDETLTTQDARVLAIDAGIKKKKRKALEDAFAATVVLQSFLDNEEKSKDS